MTKEDRIQIYLNKEFREQEVITEIYQKESMNRMTMTDIVTAFGVDLFINKKGNYDIKMNKDKKG